MSRLKTLQEFLKLEAASGILLLAAALTAIAWANLDNHSYSLFTGYRPFPGAMSIQTLINDVLMTIFFFVVGMEIKRELSVGELNSRAKAMLPAVAALGGMLVPALIYLVFNAGQPTSRGWGIPLATDIAFCVGILTLLKRHVARGLVVFLTALAIFDDIGGILVIALFYGKGLHASWLILAAGITAILYLFERRNLSSGWLYGIFGALLWFALHEGGIHATISGVVTGFMITARSKDSPLERFIHRFHGWVAFGIMPLFALANAGVSLSGLNAATALAPVTLGTGLGLFLGKPLGIFIFTAAAIRGGLSPMPREGTYPKLLGISVLAGIGFTVALFIGALAFEDDVLLLTEAKIGIVVGSAMAGLVSVLILKLTRQAGPKRSVASLQA